MVVNSTAGFNIARGAYRAALKPCRPSSVRAASTTTFVTQNPYYPLYPSVHQLLLEKGIPNNDITKIRATGPKGRLLKGDVLSYIGELDSNASLKLAETIAKRDHLDLSNIKIATPTTAPAPPPPETTDEVPPIPAAAPIFESPAPPAVETPSTTKVTLQISIGEVLKLQDRMRRQLDINMPLGQFVLKASRVAAKAVPLSSMSSKRRNDDALYNEILGIQTAGEPKYKGGSIETVVEPVEVEEVQEDVHYEKLDIIDALVGKKPKKAKKATAKKDAQQSKNQDERIFSVTVPLEERARGERYLRKIQEVLQDPYQLMSEL